MSSRAKILYVPRVISSILSFAFIVGCTPTTTTQVHKPVTIAVGKGELVITATVTTTEKWDIAVVLFPIPMPQTTVTAIYDIKYKIRKGLFSKHAVTIFSSSQYGRPPGVPPPSDQFVEFAESESHSGIDLYVPAETLTREQYIELANSIKANYLHVQEAFGKAAYPKISPPVRILITSIRHSVWKWQP